MNERSKPFAVEAHQLTVRFGDFSAVKQVSFSVPKGEIFGFLGANGAGKTTTIRVLCGLLLPTSGWARVAGIRSDEDLEAIKSKVGYMSQKFTLYNDLTIEENLAFIAQLRKLPDSMLRERSRHLLDFIGFNKPVESLVRDLPGGIKQQMALAGAILHDPDVIFLDEPTAGVTPAARARFWALIRELADQGKTIFVTTHYMDEAEQCQRIALMRGGEIIALESPDRLKAQTFPEPLYELLPREGMETKEPVHEIIARISQDPSLESIQPYGLRYHAVVRDQKLFSKVATQLGERFEIRRIEPSLEDVFIRLVEGANR